MLTLEEIIENVNIQSAIWLEKMGQFEGGVQNFSDNFHFKHILKALLNIQNREFQKAKNEFYISALVDVLQVSKFSNRLLDYNLPHICYALLCDNESLILAYSRLRYSSTVYMRGKKTIITMDEMVSQGKLAIWCNTVQYFMANDLKGIERNLDIIETITLRKLSKSEQFLRDDFDFYLGLYDSDRAKMEEILEKLTSLKIHKRRSDDRIAGEYISVPAIGYAKLAWRKGIEVEVKSKLVPKELLPIRPLETYDIPYDFLKGIL